MENWLVEQYVHGPEFAINTFTVDGEHHIIDIWEYCQPDLDAYDQPYWDLIQLGRDDPRWDEAAAFAPQVAEAFGVRLGPAHIEAKVSPDGFTLIEVGARLPGACMPEHWIAHSRFHPYDDTLSLLLGEPYRNRDVLRGSSGVEFDAVLAVCCIRNDAQPGILRAIRGADAVLDLPGVDAIHLQLAPGDRVPVTRDLNSVVAKVLVSGTSRAELRQKLHAIRSTIQLEIVS